MKVVFFLYSGLALFVQVGHPFLCWILAVLLALGVVLPYWELAFLLRVGTVPRSWGWSRWSSFLGGILARVGPAFLHLGLGFPFLLGIRLPSSGEGCPFLLGVAIGHSFLGPILPSISGRRHQGGCQDQFQTKKGNQKARQEGLVTGLTGAHRRLVLFLLTCPFKKMKIIEIILKGKIGIIPPRQT